MQRGTAVHRAITRRVRRQRNTRPKVRTHQQRIDHAGSGSGIGQAFVAARRHARERERRAAEQACEGRDLLHVRGRIAPYASRIGEKHRVNLVAANHLAVRTGDAEVSSHHLEPMAWQISTRKIVAAHRIERVDQLAARCNETHPALVVRLTHGSAPCRSLTEPGHSIPTQCQRDAERASAPLEKRNVESVQVVILDHVRIRLRYHGDQPTDQVGLGRIAGPVHLEHLQGTSGIASRNHEDAIVPRIESGGLQIELQPMELVEREIAEVGAPCRHEILLLGSEQEDVGLSEVAHVPHVATKPVRRAMHDGLRQCAHVVGRHQVAQRSRATQFAKRDTDVRGAIRRKL